MIRILLSSFLFLGWVAAAGASEPCRPATGWKADWITLAGLPPGRGDREGATLSNLWLTFRKEFSLENIPSKASARIACDSQCRLYVNGKRIVFEGRFEGEAAPKETSFDRIDLAPHLKPGKNVVAVLVWFFGKDGFSHKNSGIPGFLFDLQADGFELLSDATWKAHLYTKLPDNDGRWKDDKYTAYERITADPQPDSRLPESNIRYDARFEFKGDWTAVGFDDSDWKTPEVVGKAPCAPWNDLYERPVPRWKDFGISDYVNKNDIPAVSDGTPIVCALPYEAQIAPVLKVDAPEGYCIDIRTDRYREGDAYGIRSEYVTKKGVQEYESPGRMNGRAVLYTMPAGIKILELRYRPVSAAARSK